MEGGRGTRRIHDGGGAGRPESGQWGFVTTAATGHGHGPLKRGGGCGAGKERLTLQGRMGRWSHLLSERLEGFHDLSKERRRDSQPDWKGRQLQRA